MGQSPLLSTTVLNYIYDHRYYKYFYATFTEVVCEYTSVGDGKTHYIKSQLNGSQHSLVIAVNESFTVLNAILKLRSLPRDESCKIFFNFTIFSLTVSIYAKFNLLILN